MLQDYVRALVRAILGVQEYREAFLQKSQRSSTWLWHFWGRSGIAFIAVVFFLYQQFGHDVHIAFLSSDFVAYAVLLIGLLQAAAPLCYLAVRFFLWFFITETYKRDLARGKWPDLWKSLDRQDTRFRCVPVELGDRVRYRFRTNVQLHCVASETPEAQNGLGCVSCHSIVHVGGTMGQADFEIMYPPLHKIANSHDPWIRKLDKFITYLNPEPHRRTFMKAFMRQDSAE